MSTYPKSQVNISLDGRVYAGLQKLAKTAGMTTTGYATQLFSAAYSARHKPTGDRELDEAVAQMSKPAAVPQADPSPVKTIAELTAKVNSLRAQLMEASEHRRRIECLVVEDQTYKRQLDAARDEIDRLRAELDARPVLSIPNTAIGRFLHAWNADLRNAA
ncbi:hypothetical protein [Labrys sp. ZIDIC5]|uniref:hypothetical protein n=1 Tax=Labrys sedimenti TaxID=3106036 RepID=UPI002ACA202A|nr:hypothetical protein [Labrys sp. ZIDIC5]MDZ5448910.1 hypothetical protein [Labrys sp. ZIDIC5]